MSGSKRTTYQFTGLANATELEMPVLFRPVPVGTGVRAIAFTNNLVNAFVDGSTVLMAQSFGPVVDYTGGGVGGDIFGDYARNIFAKAGYTTVLFADDRAYHNEAGSIHCATNVIRAIPSYKWWEK